MIGEDVPKHLSITFMRKALAYEWQCKAFGGLPAPARRTLTAVASGKSIEDAARPSIQPGIRHAIPPPAMYIMAFKTSRI
jgi:hypothetical protein